jgi:hypothetical protein
MAYRPFVAAVSALLLTTVAAASTVKTGPVTWHFHGFAQAGFGQTSNGAEYNIPGHGSIKNSMNFSAVSLAGLQVEADFAKKWAAIMQVVANGESRNGQSAFSPKVGWAFLRYEPNANWQISAGRFAFPSFMYSATREVGYSYPWVTLPNEVYRLVPFNNINGAEVLYHHHLGQSSWSVNVQPFIGENKSKYDLPLPPTTNPLTTLTFKENNLYGADVTVGNPQFSLRGVYAHTSLSAFTASGAQVFENASTSFYGVGAKADIHHVIMDAEWAHRKTPSNIASLTGYYGMVGYRYNKWLPLFTYAHLKTTNNVMSALREAQQSYTLGLDYYINSYLVAKGSVSRITPLDNTNGLFDSAPGKAHVYLYQLALSAVF